MKGEVYVLIKIFSFILKFRSIDFFKFSQVSKIIKLSMKPAKKIRGHRTCLGDIVAKYRKNEHFFCPFLAL